MGMAASQARYLALTARKTNVEYEGQQINQARTALANQSAELFNQLLGLQTPIPPSVNDYQETFYTYSDGLYDYKVEGWVLNDPTSKFPYDVKVSYDANKYVANQNIMSGVKINQNSDLDTQDKYPYVIMTSTGLKNLRHIDINETDTNSNSYPSDADAIAIETIQTKYTGIDSETEFYSYEQNGTSIYITKSDLEAYINNPYSATSELKTYYAENQTVRETKHVQAALIFNDNNQYPTQIVVEDDSANGTSYSLIRR